MRSRSTPEPVFWTPGLTEQLTPLPQQGQQGRPTPIGFGATPQTLSGTASESQHHALTSMLSSLQTATQKGANR